MANEHGDELISLDGAPAETGLRYGTLNGAIIAAEVRRYFDGVKTSEGHDARDMLRAGAHYRGLVEQYAPHWLAESAGIARGAGLDPELYITYQGCLPRGINRPECFSYFSAPRHNARRETLLHKNRDNREMPQCAYVLGNRVPGRGIYRFMAGANVADFGPSMALNEKGLAVVADMGIADPRPKQRGMMNPQLLRLVAEQAATVAEARDLLVALHKAGVYAGGKHATYWLLADRHGDGLRLYMFHNRITMKRGTAGILTMRDHDPRANLVTTALRRQRGAVTAALLNDLARQAPVLQPSNILGYTAAVPPAAADLFGYAHFALHHAGKTLFVPLYMGVTAIPKSLLDGTVSRLSGSQRFGAGLFSHCTDHGLELQRFEQDLEQDRAAAEQLARLALRRQGRAAAQAVLTDACLRFARRAELVLRLLQPQ